MRTKIISNFKVWGMLFFNMLALNLLCQVPHDSIENVYYALNSDTAKVNHLVRSFDLYSDSDMQQVHKYLNQALEMAEDIHYTKGYAQALRSKGNFLLKNSNYDSALHVYRQSLETFIQIKEKDAYPQMYNNIGIAYKRLSNYDSAEYYFNLGKKLAIQQEKNKLLAGFYNNLGEIYRFQSRYDTALHFYSQCLQICEELNDSSCISIVYNNIGIIYAVQGKYNEAIKYFSLDIDMNMNTSNKPALAHKYHNIGIVYAYQGNYPKAQEYFFKSLNLRNSIGDKTQIANTYNSIGEVFKMQNDLHAAIDYFRKSLVIYEVLGDKTGIANTHALFGEIYYEMKEYNVSIASFNRSLEIVQEIGNQQVIARNIQYIGKNYLALRHPEEALAKFQAALKIAKELGNERTKHLIYADLALTYNVLNAKQKALNYALKAFEWGRKTQESKLIIESAQLLAKIYADLGNYQKAYAYHVVLKNKSDSALNEENIRQITAFEYQFKYEKEQQAQQLENEKREALHQEKLKRQRIKTYAFIGAFIFMIIISLIIYRSLRLKKRAFRILRQKNNEILQQKEEISAQKDEIQMQKNLIVQKNQILEHKNKEILDSVKYASKIQSALLPAEDVMQEHFDDYFLLFKPRDIVSGDFYWFDKMDDKVILIAADCTGHGVPGALMSMLGISFINEIIKNKNASTPGEILNHLRDKIKASLKQTGKRDEAKDGMDMSLCIIDKKLKQLQFAGAYNSALIVRKTNEQKDVIEIKGDRQPISIHVKENDFTTKEFNLLEGDILYLYSDGYIDQFGGREGKKFKLKNLKDLLLKINDKALSQQKELLVKKLDSWIGEDDQLDDVLILGVKL